MPCLAARQLTCVFSRLGAMESISSMKMMAGEFFSASSNALRRLLSDSPACQRAGSYSLSAGYRLSSHTTCEKSLAIRSRASAQATGFACGSLPNHSSQHIAIPICTAQMFRCRCSRSNIDQAG